MRVLIAPVGEQPTPNLIPLFALPPEERSECVQFLRSGNRRIQEVAKHLHEAISRDKALVGVKVAAPLPMNAWDLDKARADCAATIDAYVRNGDQVTVNITGGTKIMSLAAYQAAIRVGVPMLYVNTERSELIRFDEQGLPAPPEPFRVAISIETQLRAAGREFKQSSPPLSPKDVPDNYAQFSLHISQRYNVVYDNLIRKIVQDSGGPGVPASLIPPPRSVKTATLGHNLGLWIWDQKVNTFTITDKDA